MSVPSRELLRTRFVVAERASHGRRLYFLQIAAGSEDWYTWLLPKPPPTRSGERRAAIERRRQRHQPRPPYWDGGTCTVEDQREDRWILSFGGRRLTGTYVLQRMRPGHWLLFHARDTEGVHFALSAGGVVVDPTTASVVLIQPRGRRYWTLPKGTVEPGEALEETALREVAEETGAVARILEPLDPIEYWFWGEVDGVRRRIHKVVAYYLMELEQRQAPTALDEVAEVAWVPLDEAPARVTHRSERELLCQGLRRWCERAGRKPPEPCRYLGPRGRMG